MDQEATDQPVRRAAKRLDGGFYEVDVLTAAIEMQMERVMACEATMPQLDREIRRLQSLAQASANLKIELGIYTRKPAQVDLTVREADVLSAMSADSRERLRVFAGEVEGLMDRYFQENVIDIPDES